MRRAGALIFPNFEVLNLFESLNDEFDILFISEKWERALRSIIQLLQT